MSGVFAGLLLMAIGYIVAKLSKDLISRPLPSTMDNITAFIGIGMMLYGLLKFLYACACWILAC